MLETKEFVFIIGSPRSGTTMLQILLASHPQVASTVEQTLFQHYIVPWLETWTMEVENIEKRGWKLGLPILWKEEELVEFLREFLSRAYAKILERKPAATHILDKHPGYSRHARTIKRFLPQARFVHIIRDGRDVAASMMAVQPKMGFGPAELPAAAMKWKTFVLAAREAAEGIGTYLEVRYEDFLEGRTDAYARVLNFCGLPATEAWIVEILEANSFEKMKDRGASPDPLTTLSRHRYYRGIAGGWRSDFSAWQRFEFDRIAGDLLRDLGYADPGWWAVSPTDRFIQPLRHQWAKRGPHARRALENAYAAVVGRV